MLPLQTFSNFEVQEEETSCCGYIMVYHETKPGWGWLGNLTKKENCTCFEKLCVAHPGKILQAMRIRGVNDRIKPQEFDRVTSSSPPSFRKLGLQHSVPGVSSPSRSPRPGVSRIYLGNTGSTDLSSPFSLWTFFLSQIHLWTILLPGSPLTLYY